MSKLWLHRWIRKAHEHVIVGAHLGASNRRLRVHQVASHPSPHVRLLLAGRYDMRRRPKLGLLVLMLQGHLIGKRVVRHLRLHSMRLLERWLLRRYELRDRRSPCVSW